MVQANEIKSIHFNSFSRYLEHSKPQRLPDAIIIGTKKCGTRALMNFLQLHSHVASADKEMHFFNKKADINNTRLHAYETKLPFAFPDQLVMEKTPTYIRNETAANNIHKTIPFTSYDLFLIK
jgi:hypothetical protein